MSKPTEGPWRIAAESGNSGEAYAIESKGKTICWTACSLDKDGDDIITEEDKANANLITEAKAMFEALEAITARINGEWDNPALLKVGLLTASTEQDCLEIAETVLNRIKG